MNSPIDILLDSFIVKNENCDLYNLQNITNVLNNETSSKFSVLNLNIRSLVKNYDKLLIFLDRIKYNFNVIILTETWLSDSNKECYPLPGYDSKHIVRSDKRGGGVSIYFKNSYSSQLITPLCNISNSYESIFITLKSSDFVAPLNIGGIYRVPGFENVDLFFNFIETLQNHNLNLENTLIGGDFNINILNLDNNNKIPKKFTDLMASLNFCPSITQPTRVSRSINDRLRATCIDNILVNMKYLCKSGVIETNISDHYPVFILIDYVRKNNKINLIEFRDFSLTNKNNFISEINKISLNDINLGDCNKNTSFFIEKLNNIYNKCFPIRRKQVSEKRLKNPWLTSGILNSIDRNHKYNRMQKTGLIPRYIYVAHRNKLNSLIRLVKRRFYKMKFESCLNDVRSTWKNINLLLNKKREKLPSSMYIGQNKFSNSSDICEAFAKYFSEVATNLDNNIPKSNESYNSFLDNSNKNSMFLYETSDREVMKVINSFKNTGSSIKEIPTKIYKLISINLSKILSNLFNQSIQQGIFPNCLKIARIVPIFKEGDKLNIENYRPIAILPILSKILEKVISNQLITFLEENDLLSHMQHGFWPLLLTEIALLKLN